MESLTIALLTLLAPSSAIVLPRDDEGLHRKAVIEYWLSTNDRQIAFEVAYGRAEQAPDWTPVDPAAGVSRRRGQLRWQGPLYCFARETLYPDAKSGNRQCEWYDGLKTCRYNLDNDTGFLLAGPQEEDLPGARILQGLVWGTYSIVDVVERGAFQAVGDDALYRLEVDEGKTSIEVHFRAGRIGYPDEVVMSKSEGKKIRTICYSNWDSGGGPLGATVTTVSRPKPGTDEHAIRYRTQITAIAEVPEGILSPWYPQGTQVANGDTGELTVLYSAAEAGIEAQAEAFARMGAPRFASVAQAFDHFACRGLGRETGFDQYSTSSASQVVRRSTAIFDEASARWKCAATVAYTALRSIGQTREEAHEALGVFGSEIVSAEDLASFLSEATSRPLAWQELSREELVTSDRLCVLLIESPESTEPIDHVVLARSDSSNERIHLLDFPRAVDNYNSRSFLEDQTYLAIDLDDPTPLAAGQAPSGRRSWMAIAFLAVSLVLFTAGRRKRVAIGSVLALLCISLVALTAGCTPSQTAQAGARLSVTVDPIPSAIPTGVAREFGFRVSNDGTQACALDVLSKSCGCLKVQLDRPGIAPGESVEGRVMVMPKSTGRSYNTIRIGASPQESALVRLDYTTYAPLSVRPEQIRLKPDSDHVWQASFEVLRPADGAEISVLAPQDVRIEVVDERTTDSDWGRAKVTEYVARTQSAELPGNAFLTVETTSAEGERETLRVPIERASAWDRTPAR